MPGTVTSVSEPAVDLAAIRRLAAEVDTTALCDAADDIRIMSSALRCRSANPRTVRAGADRALP
jgi:hypothetical protein